MSKSRVEGILGEATGLERKYEWLEASGLYEKALRLVDEGDYFRRGEIQEKIGCCLQRAAFQAESREEFVERLRRAVEAFEVAHGLHERVADEVGAGWALRCGAISRYLEHWIESEPSEKKRLLDECLDLEKSALEAFWDGGDELEYGRTYNELEFVSLYRAFREWDRQVRKGLIEEGLAWGEKAVAALSEVGDQQEIARSYNNLVFTLGHFTQWFVEDPEEQEEYRLKCLGYLRKALESSEMVEDDYTIGLSQYILGRATAQEQAMRHYERALECGEKTQDNYLKAEALHWLAFETYWKAIATDDPDQRRKLADEAMEFYDKAQCLYSLISYQTLGGGKLGAPAPGGQAEYYLDRAGWEIDPQKKRESLEKSEKDGLEALKVAEDWDIPISIYRMFHILSRTLTALARLETDFEAKRGLLEKALKYRERNLEIFEQWTPFHYWNMGVYHYLFAQIKEELAFIQQDHSIKMRLLEDAALSKEKSLRFFDTIMPFNEKKGQINYFAPLSEYQDGYGKILSRLYEETKNPEHLRRAIGIWQRAIESASKLEMFSRIAESYWKIAKAQITIGEQTKAAESFEHASESYKKAAEKIPQLKDFYREHASYMSAWSEFMRAKQRHAEKRYLIAKEHYEKAAELYKSTERWSYLALNYLAWAQLEEAEDLSRREETEEARDLFQQATSLFKEAKGSIEIKLRTIQDEEERELLASLVQASDIRRDYCLGRSTLEDARILDRQGDHLASSRRYGSAAETFKGIAGTSEEAQKELQQLICLCQAWQKMTQAEARASPELYVEASKLFEEATEHSPDERSMRLALGHSCFCRALEAGARFEYMRDHGYYTEATRQLESAASYYVRAGFKSAADYAEATQRLFDSYVYMDSAGREADPLKKSRFYLMAERVLETSAGSYLTAKHPEKSKEVERLLGRVREKREMAASLSELMHAPTTVSTTEAFTAPSPTREEAVGLERFENADIQANLILGGREVKVGDDINIEIELVNAGKAPAQLIKVEEIIPRGFEVSSAPDICRVEDSYLDMKGRTLLPLKTAELKIVLRPLDKGTYQIKPRVLYLDEAGKYRSHEPESATVVVKELGVKGWLRGPTR